MHRHETLLDEPVLQTRATPVKEHIERSSISPTCPWMWHQGLGRCKEALFESQPPKALRKEKSPRRENSEA